MKKLTAAILCIIMVLSLVSGVSYATDENISVTVRFDAATVAADMDTLYSDLLASGIINGETTNLPSDITVTVAKGSSVKAVIEEAQKECAFTIEGLSENYITQVGFVGSDVLENLVSIPVGDYMSGNVFSSAGWSFSLDGAALTSGIDAATVGNDGAVIEGRFGLYTGWDENWNAINYDRNFLASYAELKELAERTVNTDNFSEEQKQKFETEKAECLALLSEIYNEACLNDEVSALLREAHPTFKTGGGMWIGYIEKKGEALYGADSPTEKMESANKELSTATTPTDESVIADKERIDTLLGNIAGAYTEKNSCWEVMDMGAYKKYASETDKVLSETATKEFVKESIADIAGTDRDSDLTKAILALTATGKDATKLYKENSNTPISAISKLNAAEQSTSVWSAPYTLAAYNREEYANREKEIALVNALLASQGENGEWDEFGTIDTTANAIAGLAFYMDDEDEEVKTKVNEAIEKALEYLSTQQNADGSFSDSWSGANSNSTAMVAIALAAAGVDTENDARFIKNGKGIIDGLLTFALSDNSGFGHTNNTALSDYSTEQGFRALIALAGAIRAGAAYNVYDFNGITLTPAREAGETTGGGSSSEPSGDDISVSLTIKADSEYWLRGYNVILPGKSACVYDAFVKGCRENGITYKGSDNGYISAITKDGKTLAERDNGPNSGWLYKLNGISPLEGTRECAIENGDSIQFYYTKDYTSEPGSGAWRDETENEDLKTEEENVPTEKITFADVSENHWAAEYIEELAKKGILNGRGDIFAPEDKITRAEFVTILSRIENEDVSGKVVFEDVSESAWYAKSVAWAYENGITNGISDTVFAPGKNITREDMAVMIVRYAALKEEVLKEENSAKTFSDEADIAGYALDAVKKMQVAGIISGLSDGSFAPKRFATRAETAKMISILLSVIEK
ncbi:MAG: S-layer homology domain-containing protein [Oscillospiraceae bacterium]|nr:S-layer homology domain-containing protein [Oscillospiraceae bacterium]